MRLRKNEESGTPAGEDGNPDPASLVATMDLTEEGYAPAEGVEEDKESDEETTPPARFRTCRGHFCVFGDILSQIRKLVQHQNSIFARCNSTLLLY